MTIVHNMNAFVANGKINGVLGLQSNQRDFSQYLIHFTSYDAMVKLHQSVKSMSTAITISSELEKADEKSFKVFLDIITSRVLRGHIPYIDVNDYAIPFSKEFICFTESTLPGSLSQSEIFGRFGLIFEKKSLFDIGCRPCIYVDGESFAIIKEQHEFHSGPVTDKLYHLTNYLKPTRPGIQDFTHEREWRCFENINIDIVKPVGFIAPSSYIEDITRCIDKDQFVLPIDLLYKMGV